MASAAEQEIRDAVVQWWHEKEPRARIIHELPMNGFSAAGRVDLGAVFPDMIVLMEIKSERDKLTRLEKQFGEMSRRSHDWKVIAHDKWWVDDGLKGQEWMNWSHREHLWGYPDRSRWSFERYRVDRLVGAPFLLDFLHADELRECLERHGHGVPRAHRMWEMVRDINHKMTGKQVINAVCSALRRRSFAEADPVITEGQVIKHLLDKHAGEAVRQANEASE